MQKLKDCIAHAVQSRHGQVIVVAHVVVVHLGFQSERVNQLLAQEGRQKLVVSDVLDFGTHHTSRLLIQCFLVPVWVDRLKQ